MTQPTQPTDSILNQILDKIIANGMKSLSPKDMMILDKISKGESLLNIDSFLENLKPLDIPLSPLDRFNKAIQMSGYHKDFRKVFGSNFTTRGRVTGWFIEKDFIAYMEYEDKRNDLIFDNIADKLSVEEFNDMISNIVGFIESEFKLKFTNDDIIKEKLAHKHKLNPTFVEFILYK